MASVGFPRKPMKKLQQNLNTVHQLLNDLQNVDDAISRNNSMLTTSIRMANEVLLCTIEFIKIYQLNVNTPKSNDNDETEELRQKIKDNEEIIQQQKYVIEKQKLELDANLSQQESQYNKKEKKEEENPFSDSLNESFPNILKDHENESSAKDSSKHPDSKANIDVLQNNVQQNDLQHIHKPRTFYNKEEKVKTHQSKASKEIMKQVEVPVNADEISSNQTPPTSSKKAKKKKSKKRKQIDSEGTTDKEIESMEAETPNSNKQNKTACDNQDSATTENDEQLKCEQISEEMDLKSLKEIIKDLNSKFQLAAFERVRDLLITGKIKVDEIIDTEFLPVFVECLKSTNLEIQLAAVRALAYISCGSYIDTKLIVDLNAIPSLISLMDSPDSNIRKHATRCLSFIIYEKWEFRDKCFELGFLSAFLKIASEDEEMAGVVASTIFNMCKFKTNPISDDIVYQLIPILDKYYQNTDPDILENTFQAVYVLMWLKTDYIPLIVERKLIDKMVTFLKHCNPKIVHHALSAIDRITAAGEEQTKPVVDAGVIPILVEYIDSPDEIIKKDSLSALGNIIEDKSSYRDQCIELGLIPKVLKLVSKETTNDELRHNIKLISSLCQSSAYPLSNEIIADLIPVLKGFTHHEDQFILQRITFIFWQIAVKKDLKKNQILIDNDIFNEIMPLLHHSDEKIQHYTSRTVMNVVFGSAEQAQHVIDCGIMEYMQLLLTHKNGEIQRCMLFFLRKIISFPFKHIQAFIDSDVLPTIIPLLKHESLLTQKDAAWAISSFALAARPQQLNCLLEHDFISSYCNFLDFSQIFILKLVLKGIDAILRKSVQPFKSEICQKMIECGAVDKIKEFEEESTDPDVIAIVRQILRNNFSATRRNRSSLNTFMPDFISK